MSYGDDAGFAAYLTGAGLTLPAGSKAPAVLRASGAAYLDATYGARLTCSEPTGGHEQAAAWPRTGHMLGKSLIPPDATPAAWVTASYRAAYLVATGVLGASTVNPNARVKLQEVKGIKREFFEGGAAKAGSGALATIDSEIDGLVSPLLCALGGEKWAWA